MTRNEIDIDLDDELIDKLLASCRAMGKEENYKGCADCKLKFMCWTHKRKEFNEEN